MKAAAIAVVLCACTGPRALRPADVALEAAFVSALAVDTYQTSRSFDHPRSQCGEANPIVGPCGDRVPLSVYVPTTIVLHALVSYALTGKWRTAWQSATAGFEAAVIYGNHVLTP